MQTEIANFNFYNPTRILFGKNQIEAMDAYIPQNAKVLITYGGGSAKRFGTIDRVVEALGNRKWDTFSGIEANPHFETLMQAVEKVKEENFDFIIAVGGGSVIDGTKFIAAASVFPGDPIDIFGQGIGAGKPIEEALPFGTILTLPATSSEMNSGAVITFEELKAKVSFSSEKTFPKFSVLEPEITYTLPDRQLRNGLTDTFIHLLEDYLTYPVDARLQDAWSEASLREIIKLAPELNADNHDYSVRANYMWICTNGLNNILRPGVPTDWATHELGHEITAFNNTDHARTLTPVMLATMKVRKEEKYEKLIQYAENVWGITEANDEEKITLAIDKTAEFFQSIEMPTTLEEIGVKEADIDYLVTQLEKHDDTALGENNQQTLDISRKIYETALN
ncbi:MAG: iron-containing alcohol dehydrogenase [Aerococcus suis]|nr:iron-containing alcohol dehydrogenase [Aerococcus suis]